MSAGNGFVTGIFGANTLVGTTIQGGNVTAISTLYLGSNLNSNGNFITVGNVQINTVSLLIGNSTANHFVNSTYGLWANASFALQVNPQQISFGNASANAFVLPTYITFVAATATANLAPFLLSLGNSTVNAVINSSGYFYDGVSILSNITAAGPNTSVQYDNSGSFAANSNFTYNYLTGQMNVGNTALTGVAITTGNSTVNTTINSISISTGSGNDSINSTGYYFKNVNLIPGQQTLTFGTTINWDVTQGAIASLTLTASTGTIAAPTNLIPGTYVLKISQDASGSRTVAWNAIFKWPGKTAPTLSTAASALDVFSFIYDGTNMIGSYMNNVG